MITSPYTMLFEAAVVHGFVLTRLDFILEAMRPVLDVVRKFGVSMAAATSSMKRFNAMLAEANQTMKELNGQ